jgi:hypothetical protein
MVGVAIIIIVFIEEIVWLDFGVLN